MRRPLRLLLGLVAAVLLVAAPAHGQQRVERSDGPYLPCIMPAPEAAEAGTFARPAHPEAPVPQALGRASGGSAAQFEVTYVGFSSQAQAAFQAAVDIWAQHVTSSVPIRIRARWTDLGGNLLGSAGPYLIANFDVPSGTDITPGTWYPYPLADALAGEDLDPDRPDIEASFNSGYGNWYLGTDGNVPSGKVELLTVVLHELGHGLGFIGSATVADGQGDVGLSSSSGAEYPFVYDRYTEDTQGRSLLDRSVYAQPSAALASVLTSAVFLGGGTVEAAYGAHVPLFAPSMWNEGSSYSHLNEATFPPDSADGLMTPNIAPGERKRSPGPLLCAALQDFGWTLAPACADLIPDGPPPPPPPPDDPYVLQIEGRNPFFGQTSLSLTVRDGQRVQAWLFDAAGRRLATLFEGTFSDGDREVMSIDGTALPSGVYFVRVVGEEFSTTETITNIR